MKKIFTLVMLAATVLAANAQQRYYDFTNWSTNTVNALSAKSDWTDNEKNDIITNNTCFWNLAAAFDATTGALKANGNEIAELKGLKFTTLGEKGIAIALDYKTPADGQKDKWIYSGPKYLWLYGSCAFDITNVPTGISIKMGVESHNPDQGRGVDLKINGVAVPLKDATECRPKAYQEFEWVVDKETFGNDPVDVSVTYNKGCHIYFIAVGDANAAEKKKNVAFVGDADNSMVYVMASSLDGYDWTVIPADAEITSDSLRTFDAVVVGSNLPANSAMAGLLKQNVAFTPILNLNAGLYTAWGFGATVTGDQTMTFTSAAGEALVNGLTLENNVWAFGSDVNGVSLGSYFSNDSVFATSGNAVAIHAHNPARNSYMFIPLDEESLFGTEEWVSLLDNSISFVAGTKRNVTAAANPTIATVQNDGSTNVTISCATAGSTIYYTVDGTEPTTASAVYSAPFNVTAATTVKAIAVADGYNVSSVATKDVEVAQKAAAPQIALAKNETSTTVTISTQEGTTAYYSFQKGASKEGSVIYTGPITVTNPTFIYAFAAGEGVLNSEVAAAYVPVNSVTAQTIRIDTVAHFTANQADWFDNAVYSDDSKKTGNASGHYYFGKNAWNYYRTVSTPVADAASIVAGYVRIDTLRDAANADSVYNVKYVDESAYKYVTSSSDPQWILKSSGATLTGETTLAPDYSYANGRSGRYADSEEDLIGTILPTKGALDLNAKRASNDPYSAYVESRVKFQAPFDVLSFLGNGSTANSLVAIEVSADGENWTAIDTLNISNTQRYWKRTLSSYNGTDEVYVRAIQVANGGKPQLYDIYILNNGANSLRYNPQDLVNGIEEIIAQPAKVANDKVYDLSGRRLNDATAPGLYIVGGKKVLVK